MHKQIHYYGLDVTRGLSALFIVLYHYTSRYNENPSTLEYSIDWPVTISWGCAAVTTFFVLSGFLGAKHFNREVSSAIPFLKSKFLRLFPSFFVAVILTSTFTYYLLPDAFCGIKDILLNFTMIPSLLGAKSVDGAYWTLQVEWTFYFVIVFAMFISNQSIKKLIPLIWVSFSLFCNLFYHTIPFANIITTLAITRHSQEFIMGLCLYNLIVLKDNGMSIPTAFLCVVNQIVAQDLNHILFFIATILIICVSTLPNVDYIFHFKVFKPLIWYSRVSYPLYLIHQMIGFCILKCIIQYTPYSSWWIIVIPLTVVSILAGLIHHYIEVPMAKSI